MADLLLRRLLPAAVLVGLTVALAVVAGWPDVGRSLDLATGDGLTSAMEFALIGLLCWLALALIIGAAAARALRQVGHRPTIFTQRWRRLAVFAAGIAVLAAGIVHHQNQYRVCCASPGTAQQAERLVR